MALLVLQIVLDLFGGDEPGALRHAAELELPDREHAKPLIAEHADVELAALDKLLGDGRGAYAVVDETHALGKLLVAVHHRCLRDAPRGILIQALDDERKGEARRAADLAPQREHGKRRQRDAMIDQELLRQILAAREHEPTRIAAGIGDSQQFEIARDVLVIDGFAVKLLEQIEDDVRLPALDLVADRLELVLYPERPHLVAGGTQRAHDIVFGLPFVYFLLAVPLERVRRHEFRMHEHQDPEALHNASHCRRDGL